MESIWILTNLAYGTNEDLENIYDSRYGIMQFMSVFVESADKTLVEQAFWFIGNSIGDSIKLRDLYLYQSSTVDALYNLI
jgi:hypothetical protein